MEINKYIDHTNLKPEATKEDIIKLCSEANYYKFRSVCVNPQYVSLAYSLLKDTDVLVCTVVGFPLGQNLTEIKAYEATLAIRDGASEIDMVINVSKIKEKDYEIYEVSRIIKECGANFVKTSTGFGTGGATVSDIALMRKTVGADMGVKASGGIRTKEDFLKMIEAGASRVGCSAGVKIMEELANE